MITLMAWWMIKKPPFCCFARHSASRGTQKRFSGWRKFIALPCPAPSPPLPPSAPVSVRFLLNSLPNMEANGERRPRSVHAPRSQGERAGLRRWSPYKETRDTKFRCSRFFFLCPRRGERQTRTEAQCWRREERNATDSRTHIFTSRHEMILLSQYPSWGQLHLYQCFVLRMGCEVTKRWPTFIKWYNHKLKKKQLSQKHVLWENWKNNSQKAWVLQVILFGTWYSTTVSPRNLLKGLMYCFPFSGGKLA